MKRASRVEMTSRTSAGEALATSTARGRPWPGPPRGAWRHRHLREPGDIWHLDEVLVRIRGERHYLWRAVDQDGDVLDILVQRYRNTHAAKRFFRKLLKGQERTPLQLVTDRLTSYGAARRSIMPSVEHNTMRYANNRSEVSHQPTRQRERQIRGFKSPGHALRLLSVHGVIQNVFRLGRHRMRPEHYRLLRARSFEAWSVATGA